MRWRKGWPRARTYVESVAPVAPVAPPLDVPCGHAAGAHDAYEHTPATVCAPVTSPARVLVRIVCVVCVCSARVQWRARVQLVSVAEPHLWLGREVPVRGSYRTDPLVRCQGSGLPHTAPLVLPTHQCVWVDFFLSLFSHAHAFFCLGVLTAGC